MEDDLTPVGRWLLGAAAVPVIDTASVSAVRQRVREVGANLGLPDIATAALVNVASELAHNQLAHARRGHVDVRETWRQGERGLEVVAADAGTGIADVARALHGRPSPRGSLGVGLAAVFELADEVDMDVRMGEGTCVWARKFARTEHRRRRVGIYGTPYEGEATSGDDAVFTRRDGLLVAGVIDGLGHGPAAREASERARGVLLREPDLDPARLLGRCHTELAPTRGAVMAAAQIDEARDEIRVASAGNVSAQVVGLGGDRRFGGTSFVLGAPGYTLRAHAEHGKLPRHDALVLFSDGLKTNVVLDRELLREHPIVIAQRVHERFTRHNDDATVLVIA
jgi:anti-sigma regulatory factor (Ser/Thr protein kinase)